jgi:hypothetical protein
MSGFWRISSTLDDVSRLIEGPHPTDDVRRFLLCAPRKRTNARGALSGQSIGSQVRQAGAQFRSDGGVKARVAASSSLAKIACANCMLSPSGMLSDGGHDKLATCS